MSIDISKYQQAKARTSPEKTPGGTSLFSREIRWDGKFSNKKKSQFYKELALLIRSGVDFKQALEIITGQQKNKKDRALIQKIKDDVIKGKGLYEAMKLSGVFSSYEYYSVKIGEETRKLEAVLAELQQYFDRKIKMRRQLISVFTYPAFVIVVTLAVLYFMLNNVVPMFASVFRQFGSELPALTRKVVALSENFSTLVWIFLAVVLLIAAFHYLNREKAFYKKITSAVVLRIPFFGRLIKKIYMARFCQSLHLLLSAKTPLINSLSLLEKMISFYPITITLPQIKEDITKGGSFGNSLEKYKVYDHKMISMIKVAEEINELDTMFERLTEQYNEEIEHQTKMIGVVLEPLIIIIIGIIVGTIMIAMYSPMFDLSKVINTR